MSKTTDNTATTDTEQAPATAAELLADFKTLGLFASQSFRADSIELPDGKKANFHVRELSDSKFREIFATRDRAQLIAATICDASGKAVLSAKQAAELKTAVAAQLESIALKHSGFGPAAAAEQEELGND